MSEFVEGEWNEFVFKMISEEDYTKVLENLQSVFFKDEPILNSLKVTENEDMLEDMTKIAKFTLDKKDGLSFCAFDKITGEIAGIRVTFKVSQDDPKGPPFQLKSPAIAAVFGNMAELGNEADIFNVYGIKYYAELLFTSVNPKYRGKGLVSEIYRRTFNLLRGKNYPLCKVVFTNPITHQCGIKFGFMELGRRKFMDFKNENGERVIPNATEEQIAVLMALKM